MSETPVNALGEPAPNRTDFTKWARSNLERFARQAADENLVLRDQVARLQGDLAVALAAWRKCEAARPDGVKADAWVPIHPRNGPLWSMTTDKPSPERLPNSYPLRPVVFADGVKADAWVPIHPRNGPLWSMTTDKPSPERLPNSYPLRPVVFADGVAGTFNSEEKKA